MSGTEGMPLLGAEKVDSGAAVAFDSPAVAFLGSEESKVCRQTRFDVSHTHPRGTFRGVLSPLHRWVSYLCLFQESCTCWKAGVPSHGQRLHLVYFRLYCPSALLLPTGAVGMYEL